MRRSKSAAATAAGRAAGHQGAGTAGRWTAPSRGVASEASWDTASPQRRTAGACLHAQGVSTPGASPIYTRPSSDHPPARARRGMEDGPARAGDHWQPTKWPAAALPVCVTRNRRPPRQLAGLARLIESATVVRQWAPARTERAIAPGWRWGRPPQQGGCPGLGGGPPRLRGAAWDGLR